MLLVVLEWSSNSETLLYILQDSGNEYILLMLLGAQVLNAEKGRHKYRKRKGEQGPSGEVEVQYTLKGFSHMCTLMRTSAPPSPHSLPLPHPSSAARA